MITTPDPTKGICILANVPKAEILPERAFLPYLSPHVTPSRYFNLSLFLYLLCNCTVAFAILLLLHFNALSVVF